MSERTTTAEPGSESSGWLAVPTDTPILNAPTLFREIVEHSTDAIAVIDTDGRYLYQNPTHRQMLGFANEELTDQTPAIHLGESRFYEIAQALASEGSYRGEVSSRTRGGREMIVDLSAFAVRDAAGDPVCFVGIKRDVSARRLSEQALAESEERYRLLFEQDSNAIVLWDGPSGQIEDVNQTALDLLGYERGELVGQKVEIISAEPEKTRDGIARWIASGERVLHVPLRRFRRRDDGSIFPGAICATGFTNAAGRRKVICSFQDITERHRYEQEILDISGREQRRIGQDLHDGLGQELTGIAFLGKSLERDLRARGLPEADRVSNLVDLLHHAITKTRRIASGLFPAELETSGLSAAIEALANASSTIYGMRCEARVAEELPDLGPEASLHIYRIVQEATTNAIKHGDARTITIAVARRDSRLEVKIADDGKGFEPPPAGAGGMGLHIMRYRASLLGASLDVARRADARGTLVRCALPL